MVMLNPSPGPAASTCRLATSPGKTGGAKGITDVAGNQLDGEFRGNLKSDGSGYETLLQSGAYRDGLSGDGAQGGVFQVGYLVVPNGNVIFAQPDAESVREQYKRVVDQLRPKMREAAAMLGSCERLLSSETKSGNIPSFRLGARVLYSIAKLEAWLESQ